MELRSPIQLMQMAKNGDTNAFGELYEAFLLPVYRYIYLRVPHKPTAEDLTQVVFIKVFNSLSRYTTHAEPLAYFFTIARNTVIDYVRKKKPEYLDDFPGITENLKDTRRDAEHQLNTKQDLARTIAALKNLTNEQREVILLKFFKELNNVEVATILGKSEEAVRQLQCRALKILRTELNKPIQ